jgi:hypothetical protein
MEGGGFGRPLCALSFDYVGVWWPYASLAEYAQLGQYMVSSVRVGVSRLLRCLSRVCGN